MLLPIAGPLATADQKPPLQVLYFTVPVDRLSPNTASAVPDVPSQATETLGAV